MPVRYYKYDKPFALENGERLPELQIAYHTYGKFKGNNAIWVCHALTANSDVADWWPRTVEQGRFLDPRRYYVVCANVIGSHYGSTGPLSSNPATGRALLRVVPVHHRARYRERASAVGRPFGGRVGPGRDRQLDRRVSGARDGAREARFRRAPRSKRYGRTQSAVDDRLQRVAANGHEADGTFGAEDGEAGKRGMRVSRSVGLLSYRGSSAYNATQQETDNLYKVAGFRATTYQQYQGDKLCRRFDAYSYYRLTQAFDSHNVGRYRGRMTRARSRRSGVRR